MVLILIVMDVPLGLEQSDIDASIKEGVLILIVMDVPLGQNEILDMPLIN